MKKFLLKISAVVALACFCLSAKAQTKDFVLEARMDGVFQLYDGSYTYFWGFGWYLGEEPAVATFPAPTVRVTVGDTVNVHMYNDSEEGHTIHLHGLDVDQANDGMPATSFYVQPGEWATYSFVASYAGNFVYHCHVVSSLHVTMGMYGSLIVESPDKSEIYPGGPRFDQELECLFSDLDRMWNDDQGMSTGPFTSFKATNFFVNGKEKQQIEEDSTLNIRLPEGGKALLRLINIGYTIVRYTLPDGITGILHTTDGRVLPSPIEAKTWELVTGERYSLLVDVPRGYEGFVRIDYLSYYDLSVEGTNFIPINDPVFDPTRPRDLILYPNPVYGRVQVSQPALVSSYRIYDHAGQPVAEGTETEGGISLMGLAGGIYHVHLFHKDGETSFHKLVVY